MSKCDKTTADIFYDASMNSTVDEECLKDWNSWSFAQVGMEPETTTTIVGDTSVAATLHGQILLMFGAIMVFVLYQ